MNKPIKEFEVINHGVEHSQYFQGCGVSFTKYDHVVTGIGHNLSEAYEDCLEQLAVSGYEVSRALEDALTEQEDHGDTSGHGENDEVYYHVSIRIKE